MPIIPLSITKNSSTLKEKVKLARAKLLKLLLLE
jgi:hypothetical protein